MHVTMVKKRLANGEPCGKCIQAEELLKSRGLWDRIDEVAWADENDAESPGMRLGARLGVSLAPFFLVREDDGTETVYTSVLKFIGERLTAPSAPSAAAAAPGAALAGADVDVAAAARDLADRHPMEILRWGLERWGADLGIAFSGAEDVVLVHMASEIGIPFSVFCLDTGRLHPETYRFIDTVRKRYKIEIALTAPDAPALQAFVKKKGRSKPGDPRRHRGRRTRPDVLRRGGHAHQAEPGRAVDLGAGLAVHPREQHPVQRAPRARLHLDRMRAVHPRHAPRRARARRPLVVGRHDEARVRPAHRERRASPPVGLRLTVPRR
jgi:hypothetical protein